MTDKDGPRDGAGAAVVDTGNISNYPYLENNPYRELANNDDDDDGDNIADDTDTEIVAAPAAIPETIIDVDE